jgi:hypothetical protein
MSKALLMSEYTESVCRCELEEGSEAQRDKISKQNGRGGLTACYGTMPY